MLDPETGSRTASSATVELQNLLQDEDGAFEAVSVAYAVASEWVWVGGSFEARRGRRRRPSTFDPPRPPPSHSAAHLSYGR